MPEKFVYYLSASFSTGKKKEMLDKMLKIAVYKLLIQLVEVKTGKLFIEIVSILFLSLSSLSLSHSMCLIDNFLCFFFSFVCQ